MLKLLLALLLLPNLSFAGGKAVGNGGDEIGLEFQNAAIRAVNEAVAYGLLESAQGVELRALSLSATILVTDNPLGSVRGRYEQESIAINIPEQTTVLVNRFRWQEATNDRLREGLALHEVLSLRGLEGTGNYRISGAYLARFSLSLQDLQPLPKDEQWIVNCSDYNNSLFTVVGLRGGRQRMTITPVRESARADAANFLRQIGVPDPENVRSLSWEMFSSDCAFDPRHRGLIRCLNQGHLPRPARLTLRRVNGAQTEHLIANLSFRVAAPFMRPSRIKRVDILELAVGLTEQEYAGIDAQLTLNMRSYSCR